MERSTKEPYTAKLSTSWQTILEQGPPLKDNPEDAERAATEFWADLWQIWPVETNDGIIFKPEHIGPIFYARKSQKTSQQAKLASSEALQQANGLDSKFESLYLETDLEGEQYLHPQGTFYNDSKPVKWKRIPVSFTQTAKEDGSQDYYFFSDNTRANIDGKEPVIKVCDDYNTALGVFRQKALHLENGSARFKNTFLALDQQVLRMFDLLTSVVSFDEVNPHEVSELKMTLQDENIKLLLGEGLHSYFANLSDYRLYANEFDFGPIPEEVVNLHEAKKDDDYPEAYTFVQVPKEEIQEEFETMQIGLIERIKNIKRDKRRATVNIYASGSNLMVYDAALAQNTISWLCNVFNTTNMERSHIRMMFPWSKEIGDVASQTGRNLRRLNKVTKRLFGYFGQSPIGFTGGGNLLDSYEALWGPWQTFRNSLGLVSTSLAKPQDI